jgi:hypothetical protein
MKCHSWGAAALLATGLIFLSCAGGSNRKVQSAVPAFERHYDAGYVSRVALGVFQAPQTPLGRESAKYLLQTVAQTLRARVSRMELLTAEQTPSVNAAIGRLNTEPIDVAARHWRLNGYQGIVALALLDLRLETKKTGALWFRKARHFIQCDAVIDVYDPHTGTKLMSDVAQLSLKISADDYDALQSGSQTRLADLDELLLDLADDFGDKAAEALQGQPWQTAVIRMDAQRIVVAAGRQSGVHPGDRLSVYRGGRTMEGFAGKFVLPGPKIAEIQIEKVDDTQAYAKAASADSVQPGDIALPAGPGPDAEGPRK